MLGSLIATERIELFFFGAIESDTPWRCETATALVAALITTFVDPTELFARVKYGFATKVLLGFGAGAITTGIGVWLGAGMKVGAGIGVGLSEGPGEETGDGVTEGEGEGDAVGVGEAVGAGVSTPPPEDGGAGGSGAVVSVKGVKSEDFRR